MKWWAIPSWRGDFRLVEDSANKNASQLLLLQPTPAELTLLRSFLATARRKKWTKETVALDEIVSTRTIHLAAPIETVGPVLVKAIKPADRTLTAVSFKDGNLEVVETSGVDVLAAKAATDDAAQAVSIARPTLCCPTCVPGSIEPASEVLQAFLTPQEHTDWAKYRAIIVQGGSSGHRYLLAHRHSATAVLNGRICYDLDDRFILHFHENSLPPEEEILAAKLILEHRESWLRNEATVQHQLPDGTWFDDPRRLRYKNPFGDANDGRADAALIDSFGKAAMSVLGSL
jgi:hypothetical protein